MIFIGEVSVSLLKRFLCRNKQLKERIAELEQEKEDILKEYQKAAGAWCFHAKDTAIPIEAVPVGWYTFDFVIAEGKYVYFTLHPHHRWLVPRYLIRGDLLRKDSAEVIPNLDQRFGEVMFRITEDEDGTRHYAMQVSEEIRVYSADFYDEAKKRRK
jgi:hypothetical protein